MFRWLWRTQATEKEATWKKDEQTTALFWEMHHPFSGHHLTLCVVCCLTFAAHLSLCILWCHMEVHIACVSCALEAAQNLFSSNKRKEENECCSHKSTVALQQVRRDHFLFFFLFFFWIKFIWMHLLFPFTFNLAIVLLSLYGLLVLLLFN